MKAMFSSSIDRPALCRSRSHSSCFPDLALQVPLLVPKGAARSKFWSRTASSFWHVHLFDLRLQLRHLRLAAPATRAAPRARLVDHVDRLVRQEPVRDVALGQLAAASSVLSGCSLVVVLVLLAEALAGSAPSPRSRAGRPIERAGSDDRAPRPFRCTCGTRRVWSHRLLQFAARQRRLQHIRGVHCTFGRARANDGVQLIDEQNDVLFWRV